MCQCQQYFNESRPHLGIEQCVTARPATDIDPSKPIAAKNVLDGLHVNYRRAA